MRTATTIFLLALCCASDADAQKRYMGKAQIKHDGSNATVTANFPRPLYQAVRAVREEHGWLLDYEDPQYFSAPDLVDATGPTWKASHPNGPFVHDITGGAFSAPYTDPLTASKGIPNLSAVSKVVAAYNTSGNPGKFEVKPNKKNRVSVVGTSMSNGSGQIPSKPVLDVTVNIPQQTTNGVQLLTTLTDELSKQTGLKTMFNAPSINLIAQTLVPPTGQPVMSARDVLDALSHASRCSLIWDLLWDPDLKVYVLNVDPDWRTWTSAEGSSVAQCVKID